MTTWQRCKAVMGEGLTHWYCHLPIEWVEDDEGPCAVCGLDFGNYVHDDPEYDPDVDTHAYVPPKKFVHVVPPGSPVLELGHDPLVEVTR